MNHLFPKRSANLRRLRPLLPPLMLLTTLPAYAQGTGSDPWDNAVNVLKTAFTGTIVAGLSLVAIVVGGLMFAYGEGQSKKTSRVSSLAWAWLSARSIFHGMALSELERR